MWKQAFLRKFNNEIIFLVLNLNRRFFLYFAAQGSHGLMPISGNNIRTIKDCLTFLFESHWCNFCIFSF